MDNNILNFISSQTVCTIAASVNKIPYCASCFYSFIETEKCIVFKSKKDSEHIKYSLINPQIAGSILQDKLDKNNIKGIQFQGKLFQPTGKLLKNSSDSYYKKYPFALAVKGELWVIQLEWIKYTNNTLGFGKKIIWEI